MFTEVLSQAETGTYLTEHVNVGFGLIQQKMVVVRMKRVISRDISVVYERVGPRHIASTQDGPRSL